MSQSGSIIVAGATGFIGRHLLAAAGRAGIRTVAVVRSARRALQVRGSDIQTFNEIVARGIPRTLPAPIAVVQLIGVSRGSGAQLWRSIVGTTRRLIKTAVDARVARFVYVGGYGTTEESSEEIFRARACAEALIRTAGIPYGILRCSYVLGRGDELTPYVRRSVQHNEFEVPGRGQYRVQPVWVGDVVRVLLRLCEFSGHSLELDLLSKAITFDRLVRRIGSELAPQARVTHVPVEDVVRRAIYTRDPPFTLSELAVLMCDAVGPPTSYCHGVRIRGTESLLRSWIHMFRCEGGSGGSGNTVGER